MSSLPPIVPPRSPRKQSHAQLSRPQADGAPSPGTGNSKPTWKFLSDWESFQQEKESEHEQLTAMSRILSTTDGTRNSDTARALVASPSSTVASPAHGVSRHQSGFLVIRSDKRDDSALTSRTKEIHSSASAVVAVASLPPSSSASVPMSLPPPPPPAHPKSNFTYRLMPTSEKNKRKKQRIRDPLPHQPQCSPILFVHNPPLTSGPLRSITYDYSHEDHNNAMMLHMLRAAGAATNTRSGNASAQQLLFASLPKSQRKAIEEGLKMKMIPRSALPFLVSNAGEEGELERRAESGSNNLFAHRRHYSKGNPPPVSSSSSSGAPSCSSAFASLVSHELLSIAMEKPWETTAQQRILDSCMETAQSIVVKKFTTIMTSSSPSSSSTNPTSDAATADDTTKSKEAKNHRPPHLPLDSTTSTSDESNATTASARCDVSLNASTDTAHRHERCQLQQQATRRPSLDSCGVAVTTDPPPIEIAQSLADMVKLRQLFVTLHPPSEQIKLATAEEGTPAEVRNVLTRVKVLVPVGAATATSARQLQSSDGDEDGQDDDGEERRVVVPVASSLSGETRSIQEGRRFKSRNSLQDSPSPSSARKKREAGSHLRHHREQHVQLLEDIVQPILFTGGALSPITTRMVSSPRGGLLGGVGGTGRHHNHSNHNHNININNQNEQNNDSPESSGVFLQPDVPSSRNTTNAEGSALQLQLQLQQEQEQERKRRGQLRFLRQKQKEAEIKFGLANANFFVAEERQEE